VNLLYSLKFIYYVRSGEVQRYTGIGNCFTRVIKEQGFLSLWRGNVPNVIRYFPTQAFNFAFKDVFKQMFPNTYDKKTHFFQYLMNNMLGGAVAGAGSLCIVYPLDYARTRLASDVGKGVRTFNGLGDCIIKTATGPGGVFSLYKGFGVSVCGIIPYRGVYFGLYDSLVDMYPIEDGNAFGFLYKFGYAQFASIAAAYVSYPFDTVRRRLQMQAEKPRSEWVYKGSIDCFVQIGKNEGLSGMFKGAGANAVRTVGSALVLVLYDFMKEFISSNVH
jgi:solute carrier family 25 (adenine nucleotide translocator) protein 4/5/6/31